MRWGLLVMVVWLVAACSVPAGPPDRTPTPVTPGVPGSAPPPVPTTTALPPDAIKRIRLETLSWYDVQQDRTVKLGSKATFAGPDGQVWTGPSVKAKELHKKVFYADVNGDGFLDALAALQRVDGHAYAIGHYIWVWDPTQDKPVQIRDLVAMQVSCGDYVTKIKSTATAFVLTERRREYGSTASCAEGGSIVAHRTVTLRDGHLVTTAPYAGYGGICDRGEFEGWYQPYALDHPVHLWPSKKAPLALEPAKVRIVVPVMEESRTRTWPKGWIQVVYVSKKMDKDGYDLGACGFSPAP